MLTVQVFVIFVFIIGAGITFYFRHKEKIKLNEIGRQMISGKNKFNRNHFNLMLYISGLVYIIVEILNISDLRISKTSWLCIFLWSILLAVNIVILFNKAMRRNSINENGLIVKNDILQWVSALSYKWEIDSNQENLKLRIVVKYDLYLKTFIREAIFDIDSEDKEALQVVLESNHVPKRQID